MLTIAARCLGIAAVVAMLAGGLTSCGEREPEAAVAEAPPPAIPPTPEAVPAAPIAAGAAAAGFEPLPNAMDAEMSAERALQLTLPKAEHPTWNRLRATRVSINEKTQLYTAAHPPEVRALAGQSVTVRGYMLPLEAAERTTHFLISPYTPVCFFHPPAEPNEVIEVRTDKPIEAGYHLVEVTGAFSLSNDGEKGLFFQLSKGDARIIERVAG